MDKVVYIVNFDLRQVCETTVGNIFKDYYHMSDSTGTHKFFIKVVSQEQSELIKKKWKENDMDYLIAYYVHEIETPMCCQSCRHVESKFPVECMISHLKEMKSIVKEYYTWAGVSEYGKYWELYDKYIDKLSTLEPELECQSCLLVKLFDGKFKFTKDALFTEKLSLCYHCKDVDVDVDVDK